MSVPRYLLVIPFLIASCDSTSQEATSLSPPESSDISTAADLSGAVSDIQITADIGAVDSTGAPSDASNLPCESGAVRLRADVCGPDGGGLRLDSCQGEQWLDSGLCLMHPPDTKRPPGRINLFAGYAPAVWDYGEPRNNQVRGWSYYLRAFDLVRDQPVQEVGWGQWTKPENPGNGLLVCGVHPHGFTCEDYDLSDPELENCGSTDPAVLEGCSVWCCSEEDKCGVRGSIEGGMGYWQYTLETPHVKWMMPGATNMNYELFGGTFLHDRPQPCTSMGGAVRVSNQLLVPNDFLSFDGDDVDGFVGYMLAKTPIGKRADTDQANYWTIVIDAANFAGPVMYMSAWFWDSRINWSPKSRSWSDPGATIGYIAQGFEGAVGFLEVLDADGNRWMRTNRWAFPQDRDAGGQVLPTSTLFTGHSQYNSDWAAAALEPMLSGQGTAESQNPGAVRAAAMAARVQPECAEPHEEAEVRLGLDQGEQEIVWGGLGVGAISAAQAVSQENHAAGCKTTLTLDADSLDCTSQSGWCEGTQYIRLAADGTPSVMQVSDIPVEILNGLELPSFEPSRRNDGRYLGPPAESESACFDMPGPSPADARLYCTRTQSGVWLGYRWYRFVDQPELNQVFASLPAEERDVAKCYMQARIERLHAAQSAGSDLPRWFDSPDGLPQKRASLDPALLVKPPAGMEVGFVPITVFERKREKPAGCEVVIGDMADEPSPLPADYYAGYAWNGGGYDNEVCPANPEAGSAFTYPGTIYGYPSGSDSSDRYGHLVPVRAEVAGSLPSASPVCGLPSDPR